MTVKFTRVPKDSTNGRQHRLLLANAIGQLQDNALTEDNGSWTPALAVGGSSVGVVYTQQAGLYRRVGPIVEIAAVLAVSSIGALTGNLQLRGLPFAVGGLDCLLPAQFSGVGAAVSGPSLLAVNSTSVANFFKQSSGAAVQMTQADIAVVTIKLTGFYFTNS